MRRQWGISLIRTHILAAVVFVCLGVLGGCNKNGQTVGENPQIKEPAFTAEQTLSEPVIIEQPEPSGDALQTVTIGEPGDDEQITYGGDDVKLPAGWPELLEVYEGAKLISSQRREMSTGPILVIGFETQDQFEMPMEFYEKLLLKKGYKIANSGVLEAFMEYEFSSPERGVQVQSRKEGSRTMVYVSTWEVGGN